jgi:hypothetical protein
MGNRAMECTNDATDKITVAAHGTKGAISTAAHGTKGVITTAAHETKGAVLRFSQREKGAPEDATPAQTPPPAAAPAPAPAPAVQERVPPSHPCLETSQYKVFYTPTKEKKVTTKEELFVALEQFLQAYGKHMGEPESKADEMYKALVKEIEMSDIVKQLTGKGERLVAEIAVVLWTASRDGFDKEFCSILNQVCRDDMEAVLPSAVILCRAMSTLIVPTRGTAVRGPTKGRTIWPKNWMSHRGTTMPREAVNFWTKDLMYRAPMYLATSCQESIAKQFMEWGMEDHPDTRVPVHFKFYINPIKKCDHVFYIEGLSQCEGEEELLYAPYSAFKVRETIIPDGKLTHLNPIVIEIDVQPNNMNAREDVPNSTWH